MYEEGVEVGTYLLCLSLAYVNRELNYLVVDDSFALQLICLRYKSNLFTVIVKCKCRKCDEIWKRFDDKRKLYATYS